MGNDQLIQRCENIYQKIEQKYPNSQAIQILQTNDQLSKEFYLAPASANYHGNFVSGLFCHSVLVCRKALIFGKQTFPNLNPDHVVNVALLHDIGKLGIIDNLGNIIEPYYKVTDEGFKLNWDLPSHVMLSLFNVHALKIDLTYDEYMAIAGHNGAYEKANIKNFSGQETELMLCIHWADMFVSRFENI